MLNKKQPTSRELIAQSWHKARNAWMTQTRHGTQEQADAAAIEALEWVLDHEDINVALGSYRIRDRIAELRAQAEQPHQRRMCGCHAVRPPMTDVTKIKTQDLTGPALDWAVAKCEGHNVRKQWSGFLFLMDIERQIAEWKPSTAWAQGGPIIERERIAMKPNGCLEEWHANTQKYFDTWQYGPTPLVAAMRCYVASKLGDTVDIPNELL